MPPKSKPFSLDFLGFPWFYLEGIRALVESGGRGSPAAWAARRRGFQSIGQVGRSAVQSGALPNGIPLTLIDRSASSSSQAKLRLPSLFAFPKPFGQRPRRHGLGRDVRPQAVHRRHRLVETAHVDRYRAGRLVVVKADGAGEVRVDRGRDDVRRGECDLDRPGAQEPPRPCPHCRR